MPPLFPFHGAGWDLGPAGSVGLQVSRLPELRITVAAAHLAQWDRIQKISSSSPLIILLSFPHPLAYLSIACFYLIRSLAYPSFARLPSSLALAPARPPPPAARRRVSMERDDGLRAGRGAAGPRAQRRHAPRRQKPRRAAPVAPPCNKSARNSCAMPLLRVISRARTRLAERQPLIEVRVRAPVLACMGACAARVINGPKTPASAARSRSRRFSPRRPRAVRGAAA